MDESGMLPNEVVHFIKQYFNKELPMCNLLEDYAESPYWKVRYSCNDIEIEIEGDIGFNTNIIIDNKSNPIWQFNREVVNKTKTNSKNLAFVLEVIKDFLKDI
jgi:hypothetical protein